MLWPDNMTTAIGRMLLTSIGIASIGFAVPACDATDGGDDDSEVCEAGHCDALPFADQLKGRNDPIAKWFTSLLSQGAIDSKGVYLTKQAGKVAPTDEPAFYTKLVDNLTQIQGCAKGSQVSYALSDDLIDGDKVFPRVIMTTCADSDLVQNQFVASLGTTDANGDIALEELEMFAWDPVQSRYFFYATTKDRSGLKIEVEPARCGGCHRTPTDVDPVNMPRIPIMNELTKPWTHWNAGAGSTSESFQVPETLKGKPMWERYGATAQAASRFEKVIRDANANRVAPARAKQLFRPAKVDEAMGLIRPVFCDEQVNYVSELATGEVSTDAFVSGGLKNVYRSVQATWPWAWFNNDSIQLPSAPEDQRIFVMPVRGVAETTYESQLYSLLGANAIMAVRALDWKKPMFSTFRCNLWKNALTEFATKPPAVTGRNRDAIKVLFEEIMKLGGMSTRDLAAGKFVAIADGDKNGDALKAAIAAGTIPTSCGDFCLVDQNGFGTLIDTYTKEIVDPAKRPELLAERDRRVCAVHEQVDQAGDHKNDSKTPGKAARFKNEPSFLRIPTGSTEKVSTIPASCQ